MKNLRVVTCALSVAGSLVSLSGCGQLTDSPKGQSVIADALPAERSDHRRDVPLDRRQPNFDHHDDRLLYQCRSNSGRGPGGYGREGIEVRVSSIRRSPRHGGWNNFGELFMVDIELNRGRHDMDLKKFASSRSTPMGINFSFVDIGSGNFGRRNYNRPTGEYLKISFGGRRRQFAEGELMLAGRGGYRRFGLLCTVAGAMGDFGRDDRNRRDGHPGRDNRGGRF